MLKKLVISSAVALALGGCAPSLGQLDPMHIEATQSCVVVVIMGSPMGGPASATATIPVSGLPGGLGARQGVMGVDVPAATPANTVKTGDCRP